MAFINIHTNNQSRDLRSSNTYVDNWVFVPGTAITGDHTRVYAFTTLDEFRAACGSYGVEGSPTYNYVTGLLSSGLPVLFRRIAKIDNDSAEPAEIDNGKDALYARGSWGTISVEVPGSEEPEEQPQVTVRARYLGKYGDTYSIKVREVSDSAYYLDVYQGTTDVAIETKKLCTYDRTQEEVSAIKAKLVAALSSVESEYVIIDVNELIKADPTRLGTIEGNLIQLSGGRDFKEDAVIEVLPSVYECIKDRILFQPKFLTSGGYTDTRATFDSAEGIANSIAKKMMDMSKERQDCRAVVDLPMDFKKEEQQEVADKLSYVQPTNTAEIPSASMCAPWCYMQVGTVQDWMAPSYAYLTVVGDALGRGQKVYTPKAGLTSGKVYNIIRPQFEIGAALSEQWQKPGTTNINPIMRLQGGDYVIAGNSTLLKLEDEQAENLFSESSADLAVIEIKRFVYNLGSELQYQYNSVEAFETFSLNTAKMLNGMISDGAVYDYEIADVSSDAEPRKLKIQLTVWLTPTIKGIEIYLNVGYGSIELTTGGES